MDYRQVRAGLRQAELIKLRSGFLTADSIAIGFLVGTLFRSWPAGIASFLVAIGLAGLVAKKAPPAIAFAATAMGLAWATGTAVLAFKIAAESSTVISAAVVAGTLSYAVHVVGFEFLRDLQSSAD